MTLRTPPKQPITSPKNTRKTPKNPTISAKIPKKTSPKRSKEAQLKAEELAATYKAYYEANKGQRLADAKVKYANLSDADRHIRRWKGEAKPSYPKPGSKSANIGRKLALAKAYCEFSDTDEVLRIYIACAVMNELEMGKFVVDHTVPLQARTCSGLHTHTNLRVVTEEENKAKGWHLWPDMWPVTYESLPLLIALQRLGD